MPYPLPFRLKAKVLQHVPGIAQYNLCSEHSFLSTLPLAYSALSTLASHTPERFLWLFILPGTLSPETAPLLPPPGRQAAKSHFPAKSPRSSWRQVCTLLQPSTPVTVSETWHCSRLIHPDRCLLSTGSVHTLCWMLRHLCKSHCPPRCSSPSWFRLWPKQFCFIRGILSALGQCLEGV